VVAFFFGAILPILTLLIAMAAGSGPTAQLVLVAGVVAHFLGVFVERWLFFAEAKHAVMNYY
jgi:sulfite dehydrogenase (quinone) subunit SoeC